MPWGKKQDNSGSQKSTSGNGGSNSKSRATPPRPTGGGRKVNRNDNKGSGKMGKKK